MSFEFHIGNDNTKQIIEAMREAALIALDAAGTQAATLARMELQNSPSRIDTGLLRNSITHAVCGEAPAITTYSADRERQTGKGIETGSYDGVAPKPDDDSKPFVLVGTNVEYAGYVHEGTDRMAPNRFIKNAVQNNSGELSEILSETLRKFNG